MARLLMQLLAAAAVLQQAWAAPSNKNKSPVCVIGAGPAGLSAAASLESKGYETVIFDKQAEIGGKCQSYYDNGYFSPAGAAFFSNASYPQTLEVINAAGVPSSPIKLGAGNERARYAYDFRTGASAAIANPPAAFVQTLTSEVARYSELWQTIFAPISVPNFRNGVPAELTVPAVEWFQANNFTALPVLITEPVALYGYGDIRVVPALYILQYMTPDMVLTFLGKHDAYLIDFQKVWINWTKANIKGKIHRNTAITKIDRSDCKPPTIHYRGGKQACSSIILAFPPTPKALSEAGLHLTPAERDVFSDVGVHNYFTTILSFRMPYSVSYTAAPAVAAANATSPINPPPQDSEPVAMLRLHKESSITVAWSWGPDDKFIPERYARHLAKDTLSLINRDPRNASDTAVPVTDSDIKMFRKWEYFPHFDSARLADGAYDDLNAVQGSKNTYWASGLAGFENVEWAVRGGRDVVESYF